MKIWIEDGALSSNNKALLWSGALFGLKYLTELNNQISFDITQLSESQQVLLQNEKIRADEFSKHDAELVIRCDDAMLKAFTDNKILFEQAEDWAALSRALCFPSRQASCQRGTAETNISITLNLDGSGQSSIDTGLQFFDHMLEQIAKHGLIDLEISCEGDLEVDEHHTIEDVAITLGQTIRKALGNKIGIQRYGFLLPMDESLATVALDISGRPFLVFDAEFKREYVGDFPTEMTKHFFYSLAMHLKATLNIKVEGENDHHKIEACFKGLARCLRSALSRSEQSRNVLPSTKNLL